MVLEKLVFSFDFPSGKGAFFDVKANFWFFNYFISFILFYYFFVKIFYFL